MEDTVWSKTLRSRGEPLAEMIEDTAADQKQALCQTFHTNFTSFKIQPHARRSCQKLSFMPWVG